MLRDTISAIATANGVGGVAIIRMSGKDSLKIASSMFKPVGKVTVEEFEPYRMYAGKIQCEGFEDFGLCVYFKAPRSFTGEDVVEFHCHGGVSISRGVLKQTLNKGAVLAERGEFTKRAFLNGKMSLNAAEGLGDMINGESEAEVKAGFMLYGEKLNGRVKAIQERLTSMLAGIDAAIDYPEEDIEEEKTGDILSSLIIANKEAEALLATYKSGKKIKTGVTVAICGKPNTGKSSLLNALLGYDKAIVSSVAGTTRDAVEGSIEIDGIKFNLYDTAGIRESSDAIENIGINMAEKIVKSADIVLFVGDAFALDEEDGAILDSLSDKKVIKILNKIDKGEDALYVDADVLTSAVTGDGLEKLKRLMIEQSVGYRAEDSAFLIEERHFNALSNAKEKIQTALNNCGSVPLELLALDIKEGWDHLGEITGETASESIISEIFSKFCVGK